MPIDYRIPGMARAPQIDIAGQMMTIAQMRQQQRQAQMQEQDHAERQQQRKAAGDRDRAFREALGPVLSGQADPMALLGIDEERGAAVLRGVQAYREAESGRVSDARANATAQVGALAAVDDDMAAQLWPGVRANLGKLGINAPEQWDRRFAAYLNAQGMTPEQRAEMGKPQQPKTREVRVRMPDGSERIQIVEDKPGQDFTSAPETPKPERVTYGQPSIYTVAGRKVTARTGSDGKLYDMRGQVIDGDAGLYEKPERGPAPDYEWVTRGGQPMQIRKGTAQPGDRPYDAVAQRQSNTPADAEAQDTAREAGRIAQSLLDHPGFSGAFGLYSSKFPTARQNTAGAEVLRDSLMALMTLENTGKLKGVLSNSDMELLRRASSTLDAKMSEPAARAELQRIVQVMAKVAAAPPGARPEATDQPAGDADGWTDLGGGIRVREKGRR